MSTPSISKIHVTNTTGLSLNERFTEQARQVPVRSRSRSRSRSRARPVEPKVDRAASLANARLLRQLAKKHTMQTALKLKRRSMKTAGVGAVMKRGNVKTIRAGPNGRPMSTNILARIATMKADMLTNGKGRALRRPINRANMPTGLRPMVGGAAERITKRRLKRLGTNAPVRIRNVANTGIRAGVGVPRLSRVRSRSRIRAPIPNVLPTGHSRQSRPLPNNRIATAGGRSRSRNRAQMIVGTKAALPIKARLGVRPGQVNPANDRIRNRGNESRAINVGNRGIATGRIEKRRNMMSPGNNKNQIVGGAGGRLSRVRGRNVSQNSMPKAQLGGRKVSFNLKQQLKQQQNKLKQKQKQFPSKKQQLGHSNSGARASAIGQGRGGRKQQLQQRNGRPDVSQMRNGRGKGPHNGGGQGQKQQQQQKYQRGQNSGRGGGGGGRGGRGGARKIGKNPRVNPEVKKEDLDKELDQYMATTKTENDMDYLLRR